MFPSPTVRRRSSTIRTSQPSIDLPDETQIRAAAPLDAAFSTLWDSSVLSRESVRGSTPGGIWVTAKVVSAIALQDDSATGFNPYGWKRRRNLWWLSYRTGSLQLIAMRKLERSIPTNSSSRTLSAIML